jgi:tetratricopeptide (TPR) repeat protein
MEQKNTRKNARNSAQQIAQEAWRLFETEEWEKSLAKFTLLRRLAPGNDGAAQGQLGCLRKLKRDSEFTRLLPGALEKFHDKMGVLCEPAWFAIERRRYEDAAAAFDAALQVSLADERLVVWQLDLLGGLGRFVEAASLLSRAEQEHEGSYGLSLARAWLTINRGKADDALTLFELLAEREPADAAPRQGILACHRALRRYDQADHLATFAIRDFPDHAGIRSEAAWLAASRGDLLDADRLFREVVELTPENPHPWVHRAWVLIKRGGKSRLLLAAELCRTALKISPDLPEALGCCGVIEFKLGNFSEAESHLRQSTAVSKVRGHHADLAALYTYIGDFERARLAIQQGLEIKPSEANLHFELGNLMMQTREADAAETAFRRANRIEPQNPEYAAALGLSLLANQRLEEAEVSLRRSVKLADRANSWRVHLALCRVLSAVRDKSGNDQLLSDALSEVAIAKRLSADNADVWFHEGVLLAKLEDPGGAMRAFSRCLEFDPRRSDAEVNAKRLSIAVARDSKGDMSRWWSFGIASFVLIHLIFVWALRIAYGDGPASVVSSTMMSVFVPVSLCLLFAAAMLPYLNKLSVTGFELVLQDTLVATPKGPKGKIDFGEGSRDW